MQNVRWHRGIAVGRHSCTDECAVLLIAGLRISALSQTICDNSTSGGIGRSSSSSIAYARMSGWLTLREPMLQLISFFTCWLLLVDILLLGWCFPQLLLVFSSCYPWIVPHMGCLLCGVLLHLRSWCVSSPPGGLCRICMTCFLGTLLFDWLLLSSCWF